MTSVSNASTTGTLGTSSLQEYIADVAQDKIIIYVQEKYTEEEETKYYASENYKIHLDYLIEIWVSYIECIFYYDIDYNGTFETISTYFEAGRYTPEFNDEWLDDIFERNILDTNICLK
jgi:hypothetical protein